MSFASLIGIVVLRAAASDATEPPVAVSTDEPAPAHDASTASVPVGSPAPSSPPSRHQLTLSAGFSHWYGGTYGSPVGSYTPGLSAVIRPGIPWLEVGMHYTVSVVKLSSSDGGSSNVGFAMLGANLVREMRRGSQRLMVGCGNHIGFVHTSKGVGIEVGAGLLARYLVDVSRAASVGPFFEARALLYKLPGSDQPIYETRDDKLVANHSDAQIHLGVAVTLW